VAGAGQMGVGIAQVIIKEAKLGVILLDANKSQLDKANKFIGINSRSYLFNQKKKTKQNLFMT